jgi:hypothetical protein
MRPYLLKVFVSVFMLLTSAAAVFGAQPPGPAVRTAAPLGLLRLQDTTKPGQAAVLAAAKFAVDDLSAGAAVGASKSRKDDVDVLTLDAGREWSRPLRGSPRDISFVSFQLHGSQTTIVDIGGARLGLTASPTTGSLQLMFDDSAAGTLQWKTLNFHAGTGSYGGKKLAALPTLTVRLDPATSTWDLYSGSRLLADNLPMIAAKKDQRQFVVRAGGEGAWLMGLVMADENPLYEDANANGIDDAFEKQKRGAILATAASAADRRLLAQEWKDAQRRKAPPALYVKRPMPDGLAVAARPKS